MTESYFEEAEWYLRFVLRGEDRLSINLDSCNQKRCISLSSAMEEMQLGESVAPDMEEMIVQQTLHSSFHRLYIALRTSNISRSLCLRRVDSQRCSGKRRKHLFE